MCEQRLGELKEKILERGYRSKVIDNAIEKVKVLDRNEMLQKVVRNNDNEGRVRGVFKFDKRLPHLSSIFTKNWNIMCGDDIRLRSVFPKPPMI